MNMRKICSKSKPELERSSNPTALIGCKLCGFRSSNQSGFGICAQSFNKKIYNHFLEVVSETFRALQGPLYAGFLILGGYHFPLNAGLRILGLFHSPHPTAWHCRHTNQKLIVILYFKTMTLGFETIGASHSPSSSSSQSSGFCAENENEDGLQKAMSSKKAKHLSGRESFPFHHQAIWRQNFIISQHVESIKNHQV